jgi:hypothetical protein
MITVTADDAMVEKLRQANGPAEIRDAHGNVVGFFAPASGAAAGGRTEEDWEELRRRAQSTGGRSLKEIFRRLQSLTADESARARLQKKIDQMAEDEGCATR